MENNFDSEDFLFQASLAEQAERYDGSRLRIFLIKYLLELVDSM